MLFKNIIFFSNKSFFQFELSHLIALNIIKFYPFSKKKISINNNKNKLIWL